MKSVSGLQVRRALPTLQQRHVGPFLFFDHMGPANIAPGAAQDILPHPHIHLATVTYLFSGELDHRDSLGTHQLIRPGAINWMTAGRGIVHSERSRPEVRRSGQLLHGIQAWVALPQEREPMAPEFQHHPSDTIPTFAMGDANCRLLAGTAFGHVAPVKVYSPLFYVDVRVRRGGLVPLPSEHPERAAYLVSGQLRCDGLLVTEPSLLVFKGEAAPRLVAETDCQLLLLGGEPLGVRYMAWNFVSSSKANIEQAERDWRAQLFPKIPGDDREYIPQPE